MMEPYVNYTVEQNIATIEFFTPQHNALPSYILNKLTKAFLFAATDVSCKVIILKSGGLKTFCAGASFDELLQIKNEQQGLEFFSGFANVINAMRLCPKFIIGVVQGKAIGGGVGLACACDYTLATQYAQVKLSELAVGIGPFVVGPVVERKIGTSAACELAIDATNFRTAQWAKEKGLFVEVYDNQDILIKATHTITTILSQQSVEAMAAIKNAFWSNSNHWDTLLYERAAISGKLVLTPHTQEFLKNFTAHTNKV